MRISTLQGARGLFVMYEELGKVIRRTTGITSSEKMALIVIADCADDKQRAWPSMETIAERGCMSKRTAIRAVEKLSARGLIWKQKTRTHNVYTLNMKACLTKCHGDTIESEDKVTPCHHTECHGDTYKVPNLQKQGDTMTPEANRKQSYKKPLKQPDELRGGLDELINEFSQKMEATNNVPVAAFEPSDPSWYDEPY